jgi:phage terminase large subunit-like protein
MPIRPWLSMEGWKGADASLIAGVYDSLKGRRCFAGVDLSSKIDLTALALLFPAVADRSEMGVLAFAFTPEDTLVERAQRDRAPYQTWRRQGWLRRRLATASTTTRPRT